MSLLPATTGALIRQVTPYTVHGQPYLQIHYSPFGAEHEIREARLGTEAAYPDIADGDQVVVHTLMNTVTKIGKIG
jgi:hypothetical protein